MRKRLRLLAQIDAEIDKDMAVPKLRAHGVERIFLARKIQFAHVRRADQAAIQGIRPPVVRTLDAAVEAALGNRTHACPAMPANIIEGMHVAEGIAGNNNTLAGYLSQEIVARPVDLRGSSGAYPGAEIKPLHFLRKHLRAGVVSGWQGVVNGVRWHTGMVAQRRRL